MATDSPGEEFVTIVPVGESRPTPRDPAFVTVLTLGATAGAAEVVVRRPRGARLGLGLKFEGGSAAAEKVRRLLVQSCTEDSPAAKACAPWGKLIPGDEILAIDGVSVSELTRIDCVRRLKDSDEKLTLLVRHFDPLDDKEAKSFDTTDSTINLKQYIEMPRPTALPPPVPPRKLGKKNSFKDKPTLTTVGEQNGMVNIDLQKQIDKDTGNNVLNNLSNKLSRKSSFDSHLLRQNKDSITCLKRGSPEEVRRLVRRLSDGKTMPPDAEVYIDLLSTEWERCLALADAESDDTGSSISTVVDRLSSMTSSVENSIPSTPIMQPKTIDIQKVLNCIENIDSDILKDITTSRILEKQIELETKTVEKCFENNNTIIDTVLLPLVKEEVLPITKNVANSDKNNNTTSAKKIMSVNVDHNETMNVKSECNQDLPLEKPKPMPRNTKIERPSENKSKSVVAPDVAPPAVPELLLTQTKKTCIESWLQRSEAEMSNKSSEEESIPEALPRLIDFVPKPQFKECETPTPLARPTIAPPPPPPAEAREDGSGASLDTIGELDEPTDVIDIQKPEKSENDSAECKTTFESCFWEDRIGRSDAEDKSLSNDETPPPSCPRQPPDGVETPSDVVEKIGELVSVSRLPPRLPAGWPSGRTRVSYSRAQDARSEASVKDKIAMFSNDRSSSSDRIDKFGTLPSRVSSTAKKNNTPFSGPYTEVSSLDRRLTKSQDNLDDIPRNHKRSIDRPEVLGALEDSQPAKDTLSFKKRSFAAENKPLFYGSTTTLPSCIESSYVPSVQHVRSASDDNGKNVHKSNLEYLIEQRKKSMSKLRGLVIPEVQGPVVNLPEIKIQDPFSKLFYSNQKHIPEKRSQKPVEIKTPILCDTKWKTNLMANNIPKYSPAFKRKSLQVYSPTSLSKESTPERKPYISDINYNNAIKSIPSKPPRTSLDIRNVSEHLTSYHMIPSKFSMANNFKPCGNDILTDLKSFNNVEIKICTATDIVDSDNDSAMSSTQSSYRSSASSPLHTLDSIESDSSRVSPRISHFTSYSLVKTEIPTKSLASEKNCEEYVKRSVCRSVSSDTNVSLSSSAGSAATSGSQASCSSLESSVPDSEKRKVVKTYNIDTINRRNILASAKCRSGRDAKLNSPVVETKFSHEEHERSPSPQLKSSDRLSSLTSTVSANANKGESRRRNKVIAETDSDSDSEVNVRQRKSESKNTRLKRNSSSSNKNKQSDLIISTPKVEDAPKEISERIIKEIKKAGLENYNNIKTKHVIEKSNNEIIKKEIMTKKKVEEFEKSRLVAKTKVRDSLNVTTSIPIKNEKQTNGTKTPVISNGKSKPSSMEGSKLSSQIIHLTRGAGSGVGLILAGGTDCEAKDVTVHRVLAESVAEKAGLKRGARVRSINGCTMAGLTHAQSVAILKEQRSEVIIEVDYESSETPQKVKSDAVEVKGNEAVKGDTVDGTKGSVVTVVLEKMGGGAGLGFGLDGGRDSPHGDRPLTIKKLFAGGAAARSGRILVGAELLSAGGQSMQGFTRTQAWAALKALPSGHIPLVLKNPKSGADP